MEAYDRRRPSVAEDIITGEGCVAAAAAEAAAAANAAACCQLRIAKDCWQQHAAAVKRAQCSLRNLGSK